MFEALRPYKDPNNLEEMTNSQIRIYQLKDLDMRIKFYTKLLALTKNFAIITSIFLLFSIHSRNWLLSILNLGMIFISLFLYLISHKQLWIVHGVKRILLHFFISNGIAENPFE